MAEGLAQIVEDKLGDMLRRWVNIGKGLHLVEVAMIKLVDDLFYVFLQYLEIDSHAYIIEFMGAHGDGYFPIVAMGEFTASRIISKVMAAGEMGFDKNIVHGGYLNCLMICFETGKNGST